MKFEVSWYEEVTYLSKSFGTVEASSKEEAEELAKEGKIDVDDSYEVDCLGSDFKGIDYIEETE